MKVYNINQGHNGGIVKGCGRLKDYSVFIGKMRELEGEKPDRKEAMEEAVKWCIANGILKDFFKTHGTEVINMLMAEWNLEDALVVEREEGREEGREEDVKNLLDFGMSPEQISRALKLPLDVVRQYLTGNKPLGRAGEA